MVKHYTSKIALLKYVHYMTHKQTESRNVFKLPTTVSALYSKELKEVNTEQLSQ